MPYVLDHRITFFRRRLVVLVIAAAVAIAALAASTSAHQTLVRSHIARDGSVVVSGYDGGVPVAPSSTP